MKPIAFVFLMMTILTGCAGAAKEKKSEAKAASIGIEERSDASVVPMKHPFPASPGVAYLVSEQFFLCREKDFCPVPQQKFTERFFLPKWPKPIREEPIVKQPAVFRKRLSETSGMTLLFAEGEVTLTEAAVKTLDEMFDQIKEVDPLTFRIVVAGYTDGTGSKEKNAKLAEERAEVAAEYFVGRGVPKERIISGGRPLCCYVAPNDTEEGRAKNRRAEVFVEPVEEGKDEKKN